MFKHFRDLGQELSTWGVSVKDVREHIKNMDDDRKQVCFLAAINHTLSLMLRELNFMNARALGERGVSTGMLCALKMLSTDAKIEDHWGELSSHARRARHC